MTRGHTWTLVLALAVVVSCRDDVSAAPTASQPPPPKPAKQAQQPAASACEAALAPSSPEETKLAAALCREIASLGVVGAQVAVVVDGELKIDWAVGRRCVDEDAPMIPATRQRIGSVTKLLTATALQARHDAGGIDLDETLAALVPDVLPQAETITLRHLLTHTSGLPDVAPRPDLVGMDDADRMRALYGEGPVTAPGETFAYSNAGYELAAAAAAAAGVDVLADVQTMLADTDAGYAPDDDDACGHLGSLTGPWPYRTRDDVALFAFGAPYTRPAGGVIASAHDLARVLAKQAPAAIAPPHVPTNADDEVYAAGLYGQPDGRDGRVWFHPGHTGDFSADVWWVPGSNVAVAVIANGSRPLRATGLMAVQLWGGATPTPRR